MGKRQKYPGYFFVMMDRNYGFWTIKFTGGNQNIRILTLHFPKLDSKTDKSGSLIDWIYSEDVHDNLHYKRLAGARRDFLELNDRKSNDCAFKKSMANLGFRIAKDSESVKSLPDGIGGEFIAKSFLSFRHSYVSQGLTRRFQPLTIFKGVFQRDVPKELWPDECSTLVKIVTTVEELTEIAVTIQFEQNEHVR